MARLAFIVAALMLATIGLSVASVPNLVGNWTGSFESYANGTGYVNAPIGALTMTISEQKVASSTVTLAQISVQLRGQKHSQE
jgi:hypothetical protein